VRTLLICHADAPLDRDGLTRWLRSFSDYVGTLVIQEPPGRLRRRIAREVRRVGYVRFVDVLAFRAHYALFRAAADRRWERSELETLRARFPNAPDSPELLVQSPNSGAAEAFMRERRPDLVIARCKTLVQERIMSIPRLGIYVLHPGICPEYRNAHGCFWAIAMRDYSKVGATLLRIDRGIDTGPVFAHFPVHADPRHESHIVTQHRSVLEHLDDIREKLCNIETGTAVPLDTAGRQSATWGQPWLSAYLRGRRSPISSVVRSADPLYARLRPGP
jgi:hypothetical protein